MDEEEKSSLHESDKSSQMVQIKEFEEEDRDSSLKLIVLITEDTKLGAVSTFDIGVEADQDSSPAMETQNNKGNCKRGSSGIEEETAKETPQSMGEAEATEGVSTFGTDDKTRKESSLVIETRNDDPLELKDNHLVLNKTELALVQQAEVSLEEPVVETHIAATTEKETVIVCLGPCRFVIPLCCSNCGVTECR
ncbi:hypothetical protein SUGI_1025050 [Cryptomeria japonica]|nr:hypothetical protein SUGI_1025050 [Cryptomeria japonica]